MNDLLERFKKGDRTLKHVEVLKVARHYLPDEDFVGFSTDELENYINYRITRKESFDY